MKPVGLAILSLVLVGMLAACTAEPPSAEVLVPPVIVDLQVTPAVAHWLPRVAACAEDIPDFGIFTRVLPRAELSLDESDLILRLGERLDSDPFAAVMGIEEIVVFAGEDVPVSALSLASLQGIYAGSVTHWGDVPEADHDIVGKGMPIRPLSYPEGHEIEILFRRAYLEDEPILAAPQMFSTVEFLQILFEQNPDAIGYLLESQVPAGVRILSITDDKPIPSGQYVLAITSSEPEGRLKQVLLCLQNTPSGKFEESP